MHSEDKSVWKAMTRTPPSIALIIFTFISLWFVGGLSVLHFYLISTNQTTYENFRYKYDRRENPYNLGVVHNFKEVFFSSVPPSRNNFRALVPLEESLPARTVGGGFISPNMGRPGGDLEMGRKATWSEGGAGPPIDLEAGLISESGSKESGVGLTSYQDPNQPSDVPNGRNTRGSNWDRKSGSWEISPEVAALASEVGNADEAKQAQR